jgi:hypothetical protein
MVQLMELTSAHVIKLADANSKRCGISLAFMLKLLVMLPALRQSRFP